MTNESLPSEDKIYTSLITDLSTQAHNFLGEQTDIDTRTAPVGATDQLRTHSEYHISYAGAGLPSISEIQLHPDGRGIYTRYHQQHRKIVATTTLHDHLMPEEDVTSVRTLEIGELADLVGAFSQSETYKPVPRPQSLLVRIGRWLVQGNHQPRQTAA